MAHPSSRISALRFVDSWASVHLDLLRGVAALLVVLEHWRNTFYVDFPSLTVHRRLMTGPYGLAVAGHQSVVLFFVLSGYFIGGTVFRAVERNQWQWSDYLLRRLVRLWIVLIPALLLCLFWDRLGIFLGRAPGLYGGAAPNHITGNVTQLLAPHIFFGNLFFLQNILTPVFGSDGALWSLANEFWYYILFPLGLLAVWRSTRWGQRLLCALLFLAIAYFVRSSILISFPIWLAGAVLFRMRPPSFSPATGRKVRVAATAVYFCIFFSLSRLGLHFALGNDYLLAAFTLPYLWLLLSDQRSFEPRTMRVRASRELARFSFTMYAAHLPLLIFLASIIHGNSRWYPGAKTILLGWGVLLVTLVYAYGLAFLTEFRTDAARMWLERRLGMNARPAALPSNPLAASPHSMPKKKLV